MNVTRKWKRFLAVGCSHGIHADPSALAAVLKFKNSFKPEIVAHLGDAIDVSAFMGSKLDKGDGDPIEPDVDGGIRFLKQLRPNVYLMGNHEDRLDRLVHSRNEIVAYAAAQVVANIGDVCEELKCKRIPYSGNDQSFTIGNVRLMHGTLYNVSATRDHAEAFAPWKGSVVHAHNHTAAQATGRRADSPLGFGVGTLTNRANMDYAKTRRQTTAWSHGMVWGYVSEKSSQLYLSQRQSEIWLLPT